MGAVIQRYIHRTLFCLALFSWGLISAQSINYSPNQSVYCGASGQIEFSLGYTALDASKVYWIENGSFTSFPHGTGETDTLFWSGNSSVQSVKVYMIDSSATPIKRDSVTLNFSYPLSPSLSIGSSFEKCSGAKSVTFTPSGGQFTLDNTPVNLSANGELDIDGLDVGTHTLTYTVTNSGCSSSISQNFQITGFVFSPVPFPQVANVRFGDVTSGNLAPMLGYTYNGKLLYKKCSSVSGSTFQIDLLSSFVQFGTMEVDWGDGSQTSQAISTSSSASHSYTQAGLYSIDLSLLDSSSCVLDTSFYVFFGANPPLNIGIKPNSSCLLPNQDTVFVEYIEIENFSSDVTGTSYKIYSQLGGDTIRMDAPLVSNGMVNYPNLLRYQDSLMYTHAFTQGSCGLVASNGKQNIYELTVEKFSPCASSSLSARPAPVSESANPEINGPISGCTNTSLTYSGNTSSGSLVELSGSNGNFSCDTNHVGVWEIYDAITGQKLSVSMDFTLGPGQLLGNTFNFDPAFWTVGSPSIDITFNKAGTYKIVRTASLYSWTSLSTVPCGINYDTLEVCIDEVPIAEFTSGLLDSICASDPVSVSLLVDSINCSNLTTYELELYNGSTLIQTPLNSETTFSASFSAPSVYGEYYLKGTVSNECGDSSVIDTFYVFEPVVVVPKETSSAYCRDSVVIEIDTNLFHVNTDSSEAYLDSVFISPSSGWDILGTGEYRFNSYGIYDIKVFYQGFCNKDSAQYQLILNAPPVATFSLSDTSGCSPFSPAVSLLMNNPNYNHSWFIMNTNGSVVDSASTSIPIFTFSNTSNTVDSAFTIIHYVFDGTSSCLDTAEINVIVYPDPVSSFVLPSVVCAGDTLLVQDASQGNGLLYRWGIGSGSTGQGATMAGYPDSTLSSPQVYFPDNQSSNPDTTYLLWLVVESEDGCVDSSAQTLLVHARPQAGFGLDSAQCGSYVGVLHDSSVFNGPGPMTYLWSVSSSPVGASYSFSNTGASSPQLSLPVPSIDSVNYYVSQLVTDSYGCSDEKIDTIVVYARPTSLFTVSDVDTCGVYELLGKVTDNSQSGLSTSSVLERRWLVERDNVLLHDSVGTTLDYALTNTGVDDSVYTITLMVTNGRGCMDTSSVDVTIYPDARAEVDSLVSLTQCAPFVVDSTVLKAVEYPNANGTYTWTVLGSSMAPMTGASGLNFTIAQADTSVVVRLLVSSLEGCMEDSVYVVVTTIPNPDPFFTLLDSAGCSPYLPVLDSIDAPSGITHQWEVIDSSNTSGMVVQSYTSYRPTFSALTNTSSLQSKTYWIKHKVTAGTGCSDSASIAVVVYPDPVSSFVLPSVVCAGDTLLVQDASQGNGLLYRWGIGSGSTGQGATMAGYPDSTLSSPQVYFPDNQSSNPDTTYLLWLVVESEDGCVDSSAQTLLVHARPQAGFGLDSAQCGSYVGVLHDSSVFNGPGPMTYLWSVSSSPVGASYSFSNTGASSPQLSLPVPSIDSVNYYVSQLVTDSYGCSDEKIDTIVVYARPTSLFTVSDVDTCGVYELLGKVTDNSQSGLSTSSVLERRWLVERDNVLLHDSVGTTLDYALTNTGVDDSVYTITLMVTNGRGCMDTSSVDVTIYPDARAEVIANASLYNCAPFLVDTSIVSATEFVNANDTYTWNVYDSLSGSLVYGPVNGIDGLSFTLPVADSTVLIVLSTSNTNGCGADSDTITLGTLPNPDASFTFYQDTVCSGDSIYMSLISGNGQTTYDWYIDSTGNGMQYISSGTSSFISTLENDGDTALQQMLIKCVATIGSTGCSDSITLPISVRPNPVPYFTQNLVCGLDTVQLLGNTAKNSLIQSWNWILGTTLLTGQSVDTYYGNAGYYSGILATTTYDGCMRQIVDSIIVYDYPTAFFGINTICAPDTTCSGEAIVFNDSSQTTYPLQGIVNSWGWDIANDGTVESTVQNYTTSLNGYGPVEIELLVSNHYGCADSIVKSTFIQVEPQAEINFTLDTTCAPWQTSFVVQDTGYIDSTYYVLRALDGLNSVIIGQGEAVDSVIKTLQPNYLTDSIYTIEHTVWNCCGSSTDFDSIYLKTPPVADYVVVPDTGCTPLTVTFMLQNRIHGNATSAALDFGNGRIDTITPQLIVSPSGVVSIWPTLSETYTYGGFVDTTYFTSLTVWNECDDSTVSIAVNVQPNTVSALIDAPSTEGCAPFTVDFENLTTGATNYSWCFDWNGTSCQGSGSNSFEPSWTYSTPGNYEVALFADNGCGYDTAYLEIVVNPSPISSFTHNAPVCANDTLALTNTSTVSFGFISVNNWTLDSLTTSQNQDLSHVITQGGSYSVSLFIESDKGCSDSSYQVITINHNPKVNFSFNNTCWNEQPVQFYDSTSIQGATINYTYWDFGDGNGSISLNPSHTYAQPGTYQVKLIKGSTQGCLDSIVQTITIFDIPETHFRAVLTSGDSCSVPQTYEFQNLTTGAQAYIWDFDYLNSPGQFTSSQTTPSFTYLNAGVYQVRLISFNAFGCTDTAFKTVVVNDGVVADFDVSPVNGCDPLTLNLFSQPIFNRQLDTIAFVRWELSNGWTSNTLDSISFVTIDQPGQYELNYYVYTNQGCSDSIIGQIINVYPTPQPNFTISKVDIRTFDFINNGVYLDTTLQFLWSFGDGDTSNAFSPRHRYLQTTMMDSLQVCLIVRNSFNCFESICKPIFMWDYNLSVPNSIVPERIQFGEDALFLPKGHDLMTYNLSIFDKWGSLVFETTALNDGAPVEAWNGRLNNQGEILPMGAYVWKIEASFNDGHVWQGNSYSGEKPKRYGTLMLIR